MRDFLSRCFHGWEFSDYMLLLGLGLFVLFLFYLISRLVGLGFTRSSMETRHRMINSYTRDSEASSDSHNKDRR